MTTKCLDNKICTFKFLLSWRFPRKTAFWTIFLSAPKRPPPSKSKSLFLLSSRRLFGFIPKKLLSKLLMTLFLMGCFPVDFQEVKRPLRTKSGKRPIKVGKLPIEEGKRPIKAMVLVGISVGCLMGCFRAPLPGRRTAPLKRSMKKLLKNFYGHLNV